MTQHLREILRDATSTSHARLDAAAGAFALDEKAGYGRFLRAHASAIAPLERGLEAAGIAAVVPDWPERARAGALERDLRALDVAVDEFPCPSLTREPALLGAAYVLEGSRLGAQFLLRRVPDAFPSDYLRHGQGKRLWPEFLRILEVNEAAQRNPAASVAAALLVFRLFEDAFARELVAA